MIIPVYKEDENIFRSVISSVSKQNSEFIVFGDSCEEPYKSITREYGGKFVHMVKHAGKRGIMSVAINYVETPLVMFVDSDTILPEGSESDMLLYFSEKVGGVGSNISIYNNGRGVSQSSEFVERVREVLFRALSKSGSVMVLDGRCVIYRTDVVRPFLTSEEFIENRVFGKKSILGDDRQITSYIIRSGYKAVKDYDVKVTSFQYNSYKKFFRQQIRWARVGWTYFFIDLRRGTARKAGSLYTFDLIYTYLLPVMTIAFSILTLITLLPHLSFIVTNVILGSHTLLPAVHRYAGRDHNFAWIFLVHSLSTLLNLVGVTAFGVTISFNMKKGKLRTFAYGAIALVMLEASTIYSLFTVFKQGKWMTR